MDQKNAVTGVRNKKNLIISGVVIILVLAALILAPKLSKKGGEKAVEETPVEEVAAAPAATTALSRADAIVKYVGSIVRFNGDCAVDPETMSIAAGSTLMLDNDTDARRTIMVGTKSYSVGAHRYTLSSMNMGVGEHAISCDGKAVSKVTIQ